MLVFGLNPEFKMRLHLGEQLAAIGTRHQVIVMIYFALMSMRGRIIVRVAG
jgi:hypothetical protein